MLYLCIIFAGLTNIQCQKVEPASPFYESSSNQKKSLSILRKSMAEAFFELNDINILLPLKMTEKIKLKPKNLLLTQYAGRLRQAF